MNEHTHNPFPVISEARIGGAAVQSVDGRDLHRSLKVGKDYSNWIKGRIDKFRFVQGTDYEAFDGLSSPDLANSKSRPQATKEYALSLDMAKQLAMVENNETGRRVRLHFLECEKRLLSSPPIDPMSVLNDPQAMRGLLLTYSETVIGLKAENAVLGQRSMALERLEGATGSMCITDAAKTLGVGRNELITFLQHIRWIFKRPGNKNWLAYDAVRPRYMEHDDHPYQDSEGRDRVSTRALVTAAGLVKLADLLVKHGLKNGGAA